MGLPIIHFRDALVQVIDDHLAPIWSQYETTGVPPEVMRQVKDAIAGELVADGPRDKAR